MVHECLPERLPNVDDIDIKFVKCVGLCKKTNLQDALQRRYRSTASGDHFENSTTVDADEWALDQVRTELTWLCDRKEAGPFADGEIVSHLAGMKAVYDTYITRISCQPGDTPCSSNGAVKGLHPHCTCQCKAEWSGAACDVPVDDDDGADAPSSCDVGGTWVDDTGTEIG